jgi:hypothetical protein
MNGGGAAIGGSGHPKARGESGVKDSSALAPPTSGEKKTVVAHSDLKSIRSTKSRRSKWGDDDAEPLGEVHKRAWHEVGQIQARDHACVHV